jgi:predicted RNase H-like HicB family nuclease
MAMPAYIALMRKDPDSDYGIEFPDFPGCVTAAEDMKQARELAEEALRFHIEGLLADGELLPRPSSFEKVMADLENRQAAVLLLQVPDETWKKSA